MNKKLLNLGIGVLTGVVGGKILSSKCVKNLAVNTVAEGLKVKESFDRTIEKVRENTNDLVAEAKVKKEADEAKRREEQQKMDIEKVAEEVENLKEEVEHIKEEA